METQNLKNNTPVIVAISLIVLLMGGGIFAFSNKEISSSITSAFQKKITLPAGAAITVTLNTTVGSGISNIGDAVIGTVSENVSVGDKLLISQGSKVYGTVSYLEKAVNGPQPKSGAIALSFNGVETSAGEKIQIISSLPLQRADITTKSVTAVVQRSGKEKFGSGAKSAVLGAAAGAALGTAVGAIAGGGRGAGRGAWSGAAIGGGLGATKGIYGAVNDPGKVVTTTQQVANEMLLQSGSQIIITLEQPVQIKPQILG